ncbi:outer membrane protein transport protein [Sansalvadorimonas sp. 2012CJ34-2]|uniref:Outer membrane protein transport protein n=1 Tax=Parendozoicomonas callyspongiae TaxID=2942213 RepID=A0ABT0PAB4_9GAMM|nr:outer membrane protein transport protein [Sansalvadorimonas sp. 2012CJ34-2]MCL6268340.1 outer membrane protein transport protein [Sansalvadorimonas sp. 2012CJ34-2]
MKGSSTRRHLFLVSSLALAVSAGNAFAGGYEKATLWDAKYSALAGAAVSSVNDSSAVYYNPAGLAFAEQNDVSLHVSPTFSRIDGPAEGSGSFVKGKTQFSPVGGFTGLYKLNDKTTLGYGIYAAGGSASEYDVTVGSSATSLSGKYSTDIKVLESGLALGYSLNNNWSLGATYRLTYAYADINLMSAAQGIGIQASYNDMSGWHKSGVRVGAMFRSDDNRWGWGINYRSEVQIKAEGKASYNNALGKPLARNQPAPFKGKDATAATALPMQIATGVDYRVADDLTLFGEVTFSKYSTNKSIEFDSDEQALVVPQIPQKWDDQYSYRIAAEYTGIADWALRGGYIYTTGLVPEEYAAVTFSTPAAAHTVTFGAGTAIMDDKLELDFAADYSLVKNNDVKGGGAVSATSKAPAGKYQSQALSIHMSATYKY